MRVEVLWKFPPLVQDGAGAVGVTNGVNVVMEELNPEVTFVPALSFENTLTLA